MAFETADSIGGIGPGLPGEIDFDLGLINRIDAIAIWNRRGREGGPALLEFDLLVSLTEDFADPIEIGSFVLSPVPDDFRMPAEVFSFEPVPARYVRILATQNDGHPQATQINEFAVRRAVFGSPDDPTSSGQIAFVRRFFGSGGDGIYVINADGTDETNLKTIGEDSELDLLEWSPDGSRIVYQIDRGPDVDVDLDEALYVINADGTGEISLTGSFPGDDQDPSWSPDSTRIAFNKENTGPPIAGIYVINADGSGLTQLTDGNGRDPDWSPDGSRIVFKRSTEPPESSIYVMNADGSGLTRLTSNPPRTFDGCPRWSPDGAKIVFLTTVPAPLPSGRAGLIRVINADGSGLAQVGADHFEPTCPRWSPDGSRIVFTAFPPEGGFAHIYVIGADGSAQTRLAKGGIPRWSPDGSRIAFTNFGDLYVMNADGSNETRLTGPVREFDWRPDRAATPITGVLDAAGFQALISPGSIVSVFGNFVETTARATSIPLSESLSGVSVTFNDIPGALFGVFDGDFDQANVQVPWNLDVSSGKVEVKVHWKDDAGEVWSDPFEVDAALASPGIYMFPPGTTQAVVTNFKRSEEDDVIANSWAQPSGSIDPVVGQPAAIGGVVTIWADGLGPASPLPETGDIPPPGTVPVTTDKIVRVFVGGVEAQVLAAVLQPQNVGLNQINLFIPEGVTPGDAVPIVIEVECADGTKIRSREDVTIAVRAAP